MLGCGSNAPTSSCACFCECNSQQGDYNLDVPESCRVIKYRQADAMSSWTTSPKMLDVSRETCTEIRVPIWLRPDRPKEGAASPCREKRLSPPLYGAMSPLTGWSKGWPLMEGGRKRKAPPLVEGGGSGGHGSCTRPGRRSTLWPGHYATPGMIGIGLQAEQADPESRLDS
jgi:hypothetical protein